MIPGASRTMRCMKSSAVTAALEAHPLVTIERGEVAGLPPEEWSSVIVATGPLTSDRLALAIAARLGVRDYVIKPFREEELLAKVGRIIPLIPREESATSAAAKPSKPI